MYKKGSELDNDSISSLLNKTYNNDNSNIFKSSLTPSPPKKSNNNTIIPYSKSPPLRSPRQQKLDNDKNITKRSSKRNDPITLMYEKLLKSKKESYSNQVNLNNSIGSIQKFNDSIISKHSIGSTSVIPTRKSQSLSKLPGGYLIKELMSGTVYINEAILNENDSTILSLCRMDSQFRSMIVSVGILLDSCLVLTIYIDQPSNFYVKTIPTFASYILLLKIWKRISYKKYKEKLSLWICSCSSAIIFDNIIQSIIFDQEHFQIICTQEVETIKYIAAVKIQSHVRKLLAIKKLYLSKFLLHRVEQGRLVAEMRAAMWKQAIAIASDEVGDNKVVQNYIVKNSKVLQTLPQVSNVPIIARMQKLVGKPFFKDTFIDMTGNYKAYNKNDDNTGQCQLDDTYLLDQNGNNEKDAITVQKEEKLDPIVNYKEPVQMDVDEVILKTTNEINNPSSHYIESTGRNVHVFFGIDQIVVSNEDILSLQSEIVKITENEQKFRTSVNENFESSVKFISLQQDILSQRSVLQASKILAEHKEKEEKFREMRRREEIQKKKKEEVVLKLKAHEIQLAEQRGAMIAIQQLALEQERKQKLSAELRKRREENRRRIEEKKMKEREEKLAEEIRLELESKKFKIIRDVMADNFYERTDMKFASDRVIKTKREMEERMKIKIREELEQERLEMEQELLEEQERLEEKERRREERLKEKEMKEEEKRKKQEEEQLQQELEQKLLLEQIKADITSDVTTKFEQIVNKLQNELELEKIKNVKISRTKMFMDETRAKLMSGYILDEDDMGEVPGQRIPHRKNISRDFEASPPTKPKRFRFESIRKIAGFLGGKSDLPPPDVIDVVKSPRKIPRELTSNQMAKRIIKRNISKWMRQRYFHKYKHTNYLRVQILNRIIDDCSDMYIATIALSTALDNDDSHLAVSSCKILAHILSVDSSHDKDIHSAYLIEASYTFRENPTVILHISNCVSNLCSSATKALSSAEAENFKSPIINSNLKKLNELFDAGVIEMFLHAATQHTANVGCMYAVTKAMQRLAECHMQSRHLLGSDTACEALNLVCVEHMTNLQILENIMKTIINLCSNSQEHQNRVGAHGLCTSIVNAMHEHKLDQNFVKVSCKVVAALCKNSHKPNHVRFSSDENPLKLSQVLMNHVKNPKLFEQLSWAIISMISTSTENGRAFNNAGISDLLLKVVALDIPANEKVVIQSSLILAYCIDEINMEQSDMNSKVYKALRKLEIKGPSLEIKKIAKFTISRAFPARVEMIEEEDVEESHILEAQDINDDEYYNSSSSDGIVVIDKSETTSVSENENTPNKVNNFLRDIPIDAVSDQQHKADLETAKLEMEERLRTERLRFEEEQRDLEERLRLERLQLEKEQHEMVEKLKADLEKSKAEIEATIQANITDQFEKKLKYLQLELENEREKMNEVSRTRKYLDETRQKLKLKYILEDERPEDIVMDKGILSTSQQSKNSTWASAFLGVGKSKTNADDKGNSAVRTVPTSTLTNQQAKKILRRNLSKFLRLRYFKKYKHTNYLRIQILFRIIENLDNIHVINIGIATSLDEVNLPLGLAACKALAQITTSDSSRDKEVHGSLLIEAAYAFKENSEIILHISNCISNLCTAATLTLESSTIDTKAHINENLKKLDEIFDAGVCEILSEVSVIHLTSSSCIYAITKAAQRLSESHPQSRHSFGTDAACESLKKVCDEHRNNPQIQDNVLKSIITVSNDSEENQNHLGSHGLCTSILLAMSEIRVDENIIKLGCKSIISLCANNHKQNQIRFSSDDNPTILCQILLNYIKKQKIFEQISWAILTLVTTSRDNSNAFNECGLVDILARIISLEVQCHEKVIIQSALMLSYIIDELNTSQLEKNKEILNYLKQLELNGTSSEVKKAAKFALSRAFPISHENNDN